MLTENLGVSISFYNEKPLTVELPNQVTCTIDTTDVALKGQTASSSYKPATLDNGINIQVPPFIDSGDKIIVDTRTMEYIKKITSIPIVAIGGIKLSNYKKLLLNKANFLAISSYIWNNKKLKPIEAIKKLK